jgi:hypothetical protein
MYEDLPSSLVFSRFYGCSALWMWAACDYTTREPHLLNTATATSAAPAVSNTDSFTREQLPTNWPSDWIADWLPELLVTKQVSGSDAHPGRRGGRAAAAPTPPPKPKLKKKTDFVDTVSKVLRGLPFCRNQPLKSADD